MPIKIRANMTQTTFLDDTLEKKMEEAEKGMRRLHKQLQFLKAVMELQMQVKKNEPKRELIQQDLFAG